MRKFAAIALVLCISTVVSAAEWGDLSLRFVYDGEPPPPRKLPVDKDKRVCKEGELVDESLLVNAKDRGVANVVVWLDQAIGEARVPVHPSFEKSASSDVPFVAKNCRFEPHVVLVRTSQVFALRNSDPIGHTFRVDLQKNHPFDPTLAGTDGDRVHFKSGEPQPAQIECNIHAWMTAWLLVRDNPYMALSDTSGKLKISNLPNGKWTFRIWHERKGYVRQFTRAGKQTEWPKEGLVLEIKSGANDLGDALLKPEQFER